MENINQIATALIDALRQATSAGIGQMDMQRRNTFEDINNRGAKRGTLYSTAGANQQSRYNGTTYLPGVAKLQSGQQMQELSVRGNLLDTQNKIDAMNKAANELNGIDENYFNSLLT